MPNETEEASTSGRSGIAPLWPLHTWAPLGYGAAPTSTAMLHAGVLKKFGLYGLIQIAVPLLPAGAAAWAWKLALLAGIGNVLVVGFVTMAQRDLKQMLGYSSVMHMGYCFLGIAALSTIGSGGVVFLMVAHGLSVALLFMLATFVGFQVIQNVSRLLHTPLMSLTNAISAIAIVGAILITGEQESTLTTALGAIAVAASMTNIVSGFLITDRMLKMFRERQPRASVERKK